jgi:hypothetical protein
MKAEMEAAASAGDSSVQSLKATQAELLGTVRETEVAYAKWSASFWAASAASSEATVAANASRLVLNQRQEAQAAGDAALAALQADKIALEKAYQVHFQMPLEAGEGPHLTELEPFLKSMDTKLSRASAKRSNAEDPMWQEMEMAIAVRISKLTEAVAAECAAAAERAAALRDAEADYNPKKEMQELRKAELEAAQRKQSGGEEALLKGFKANKSLDTIGPELDAATALRDISKAKFAEFESVQWSSFMSFQTRTS